MIVEWYGLKCFSLGVILFAILNGWWVKFNKTKTFEIKSFKKRNNHP